VGTRRALEFETDSRAGKFRIKFLNSRDQSPESGRGLQDQEAKAEPRRACCGMLGRFFDPLGGVESLWSDVRPIGPGNGARLKKEPLEVRWGLQGLAHGPEDQPAG